MDKVYLVQLSIISDETDEVLNGGTSCFSSFNEAKAYCFLQMNGLKALGGVRVKETLPEGCCPDSHYHMQMPDYDAYLRIQEKKIYKTVNEAMDDNTEEEGK